MTRLSILPLVLATLLLATTVRAQCPNDNVLYNVPATPPCPGSITVDCIWGGEYVIVNVVAGNIYTFSTCGGATWDTEITLYSNTGTMLGSNDDGCGLQSTVNIIAPYTGQLRVLVDAWNYFLGIPISSCNSNNICAALTVTCAAPPSPDQCTPWIGGSTISGSGSIQIQQNLSPQQLITDVFLGDCLTASNIQFTGSPAAVGTFTNGWGIGINSGIVLTTGSAAMATGPNQFTGAGQDNNLPGHPLLTALAGFQTYDATVFQFSFVPQTDHVTFTYVFASDEYPEFVCDIYNDVFGFFVSGPGYAPNTNIATIPGTTAAVAIDNVNNNGGCVPYYSLFYVPNGGGAHNEYDGFTRPLTTCINTVPCETYTIIIAIADAGDHIYDSAVFLEAESFSAGVDLTIDANSGTQASSPENCAEQGVFVFTIDQPMDETVVLTYSVTQVGGAQFSPPVPVTVTFPPGVTSVTIPINAVIGTLGEDVTTVTIELDTSQNPTLGCSCTSEVVTATLYFCDPLLPVTWLDFQATLTHGQEAVLCSWMTATETNSDRFIVERSADGRDWHAIGTVPGAGHSTTPQGYEFLDRAPLSGVSYYRILQIDNDGSSEHSEVRSVRRHGAFAAYPNPGPGVFMLTGHQEGTLTVHDISGREVPFTLSADGELVLHQAAPGWYMAELRHEQGVEPERITLIVR
jgi:hypothetical protein